MPPAELPYHALDLHNDFKHQPVGSLFAFRTGEGYRSPLELAADPIYALDVERQVWIRVRVVPYG